MAPFEVKYRNMPGPVGECLKPASLATTATISLTSQTSLLVTTGHIVLDLETCALVTSNGIEAEFDAIFNCLDATFRDAGVSEGLRQAYKFVSYITRAEDEAIMQSVFKKRWPGHTLAWATVIVQAINVPELHAEIVAEGVLYVDA